MERREKTDMRAKIQAVIADEQIIELYWQREERAIQETDKKYGQFLFHDTYLLFVFLQFYPTILPAKNQFPILDRSICG